MSEQSACHSVHQSEGKSAGYRGRIHIETIIFEQPYPTVLIGRDHDCRSQAPVSELKSSPPHPSSPAVCRSPVRLRPRIVKKWLPQQDDSESRVSFELILEPPYPEIRIGQLVVED